jgi:hypothetical protein
MLVQVGWIYKNFGFRHTPSRIVQIRPHSKLTLRVEPNLDGGISFKVLLAGFCCYRQSGTIAGRESCRFNFCRCVDQTMHEVDVQRLATILDKLGFRCDTTFRAMGNR